MLRERRGEKVKRVPTKERKSEVARVERSWREVRGRGEVGEGVSPRESVESRGDRSAIVLRCTYSLFQ